ncbi:MAG: HAD-IIA family hydrolase [Deltaproteobacteria bacterium]|nr:HAD-IIA family hydrolase [Deltaproteobacteria bacterium]
MFKGFIFDLDGTVYLGERLLPGAERTICLLREADKRVVFLSNKPLYTREDYAAKLTRLGVPTKSAEVVNSTFVLIRYLQKRAPDAKIFVMGELPFVAEMARAGFRLTEEPGEIDYVVAAFDRTFDYRKLNIAFQAIKKGAHFIATNPDRTCPVEGGELPDCAGVIAALEATTLKKVEVIVGKPSPITVQVALEVMGLKAGECLLAGDRLETDIRMALESGMKAALVMSGVTDRKTLEASPIKPDYVFDTIAGIEGLL